ncbi:MULTISPECIES: hypothetical protein [unclassified Dysgonomonas]|uniref:hypothetical protein n=1 Tax=unclassified Dysgonomonas TaxID=2630389 RepID=UPI0025BEDBE8|nr:MULTISPECIES: hypothetical protein [unclassified Dysgonomonas]
MGIINREGALYMATGIDNSGLKQGAAEAEKIIDDIGKRTEDVSEKMQRAGQKIENTFENSTDSSKAFIEELNRTGKSVQSIIEEIEKSGKATSGIFQFDANSTSLEAIKQQLELQKQIVAELEKQYAAAKEVFDTVNISTSDSTIIAERKKASKLFQEIRTALEGEKQGLKELEQEYSNLTKEEDKRVKKQEKAATKQLTTLQQIRQLSEEMRTLRGTDGIVEPENLARYEELKRKLSELGTSYRIVQQEQKDLTTKGNAQLEGLVQGITGLSGAFSAGQGVISLFVKDNDRLAAIQTKLQAAMSITIGLQQVSNTLHATSSFRVNTVTKATQLLSSANTWLASTFGISNVAAKALMGTLTLGLSVAITGVIYLINKYSSDQEKAATTTKKFNESVANSVASQRIEYEKLRLQWIAAKDDLKQKEKLVRENIDAYNTFGVKINDVKDAESLFVKNADTFRDSMMLRAKSVAAMELATEKYKEYLKAMADAEKRATNRSFTEAISDGAESLLNRFDAFAQTISSGKYVENLGEDYYAKLASNRDKGEAEKLNKESQAWFEKAFGYDEESRKKLKGSGGKLTEEIIEGSKKYWETIRDEQQRLMDEDYKPKTPEFSAAKAKRDAAARMLQQWDKTNFKSQDSALASSREASLKLLNLQAELDTQSVKQQLDYEQKLLDIEQDSFDKRYRQNQLNMAKELVSIEEFRQKKAKDQQEAAKTIYVKKNGNDKGFNFTSYSETDLEKLLPSGLKPSDVEAQANNLWDVIFKAWQKGNEDLAKEQKVFSDEESLTFASQLDQQIYSIRKHYKERRKEAEKNAEDIKLINGNEDREITAARLQAYQRQLESDASYNQKVMELVNDRYAFESDRRKASIQQQISDQEELIETIEKRLTNDPNNVDIANELRDAKIQLALFNKELSKTKTEKFAELANSAAEIASSLRDALGDFGVKLSDDTNKALDGFESILKGAGDLAEGIATKNPAKIISGAIEQTKGYFNAISGILGTADYSAYDKLKSKYENLLNIWDELIDKKKKYLSESVADEVVRTEKEALDLINKQADAVKKLAQARLDAGKSAGSHSLWYRMWKGSYKFDGKNWQDVAPDVTKGIKDAGLGDVKFNGMSDMLNMTADQLQWIKENYSGFWSVMDGDFRGYLEQLITYGDNAKEVISQAKEVLTGVSFDSLQDSFLNTLLDMDSDAKDFADNFSGYLQKAILKAMLEKTYAKRLEDWYNSFAEANRDGNIDKSEYDRLQNEWNSIVNDSLAERNKLKDLQGWQSGSYSQDSSRGSYESITQDQAGAIDGRLTGIHEVDLLIQQNTFQLVLLSTESNQLIRGYKEEFMAIRNVLVESRFLWEEIRDSNNELYEIKDILQEIKKNTKGLITK